MKKAILAFGLVVMSVASVSAQEAAVEVAAPTPVADAAVEAVTEVAAPAVQETLVEAPVLDGQIIDGGQIVDGTMDMTYTAAAPVAQADCGCGAAVQAAPVYSGESVYEAAAPVAVAGCGAPVEAAPVADCGCAAPAVAPVASCGCEAAPAPCCRRQRPQVVRGFVTKVRGRRSCCCN